MTKWTGNSWRKFSSGVSFSLLLNGSPFGFFHPQRGLRQGDPLSPFLFTLVTEALSHLIKREEDKGSIHGIKIARVAPPISHLLFANDAMLLYRANNFEASTLKSCVQKYARWSGQTIILHKSFLHLSHKMGSEQQARICELMRLQQHQSARSYLGLPLVVPKSKKLAFSEIKAKVESKIFG